MRFFRTGLAVHRGWLILLLACSLAVRLLVPVGFMPMAGAGGVTVQPCPGMAPSVGAGMTMHGGDHGRAKVPQHDGTEAPCAFAGLGMPTLGGADPVLLVAAVLFAFLLAAMAVAQLPPPASGRLRPPLRAPPRPA